MPIQIFTTDTAFDISPCAGDPACLCSRCGFQIGEEEFPLRIWETNNDGQVVEGSKEWRFCETCQQGMGIERFHGVEVENDSDWPPRTCRVCGCTDNNACTHPDNGNCWWVEIDLCSHCKYWPGQSIHSPEITEP